MKHKPTSLKPLDAAAAALGVWLDGWVAILIAFIGRFAPNWISRAELNRIDRRLKALIIARASQILARHNIRPPCRRRLSAHLCADFQRATPKNRAFRTVTNSLLPPARTKAQRIARAAHERFHLMIYVERLLARLLRGFKSASTCVVRTRDIALHAAPAFAVACADTS